MIGQILDGRYQVVRNLGEGGFSKTFLAEDTRRPGRPICVVKHLQPARTDPNFLTVARRLFHSEAEALEKLGHYDQIPRLLAFFEQEQEFYLIQEFVPGASLDQALIPGQPWPEAQVRILLQELLQTLAFIHQQGVIHRDIKPENIIRRQSDDKYILVDFGSVKQVSSQTLLQNDQMTGTVIVGTPGYMAGEQGQGKPRPSSDIYALGIVAIQALTGTHPSKFQEDEFGELIWQSQANISPQLVTVLTKMVRYYFKVRYQNAEEVLQALKGAQTVGAAVQRTPQSRRPERPPVSYAPIDRTEVVSPRREVITPSPRQSFPVGGAIATFALVGAMLGAGAVILNPELVTKLPFFESLTATDEGPTLLAAAQTTADTSGDLGAAIDQLQQIPTDSSAYNQAQALLPQWQDQWQQQQAIFQQAEAAARSRRWYQVRTQLSKLPQNPHWDQQSSRLARQARQGIADIERIQARPKPTPSVAPEPSPEPTPEPTPSEPLEDSTNPENPDEPTDGISRPQP
ncbi:MAG: serine/threonine-protein kinase, partial [Cyanobacteria bacterium P01_A01_bin.17]